MHKILFQQANDSERVRSALEIIDKDKNLNVVIAPWAHELHNAISNNPNFSCKSAYLGTDGPSSFNPLIAIPHATSTIQNSIIESAVSVLQSKYVPDGGPPVPSGMVNEPSWNLLANHLIECMAAFALKPAFEMYLKSDRATENGNREPRLVELVKPLFADDLTKGIERIVETEQGNKVPASNRSFLKFVLSLQEEVRMAILALAQSKLMPLIRSKAVDLLSTTTGDVENVLQNGGVLAIQAIERDAPNIALLPSLWLESILVCAREKLINHDEIRCIVDSPQFIRSRCDSVLPTIAANSSLSLFSYWTSIGHLESVISRYASTWLESCQEVKLYGALNEHAMNQLKKTLGCDVIKHDKHNWVSLLTSNGDKSGVDFHTSSAPGQLHEVPHVTIQQAIAAIKDSDQSTFGCNLVFSKIREQSDRLIKELIVNNSQRPTVILDSTGSIHTAVLEQSKAESRAIFCLDPFAINGDESTTFNPFDLSDQTHFANKPSFEEIVDLLLLNQSRPKDNYWNLASRALMHAVIQYVGTVPEKNNGVDELWKVFHSDDTVYNLAVVLDTIGKRIPKESYQAIATFLQQQDRVRSRVLSEASASLGIFGSDKIQNAFIKTSNGLLESLANENPIVFVMIPNHLQKTYGAAAKFWITSLMTMERKAEKSFLFLLDGSTHGQCIPQLQVLDRAAKRHEIWYLNTDQTSFEAQYPQQANWFYSGCQQVFEISETKNDAEHVSNISQREISTNNNSANATECGLRNLATFCPRPIRTVDPYIQQLKSFHAHPMLVVSSSRDFIDSVRQLRKDGFYHVNQSSAAENSIQFDPLSILKPDNDNLSEEVSAIVDVLMPVPKTSTIDRYWTNSARSTMQGILMYLPYTEDKDNCNLASLWSLINSDDVVYKLAVVLDTIGKKIPKECYALIAAFLQKSDVERTTIISEIVEIMRLIGLPRSSDEDSQPNSQFDWASPAIDTPWTLAIRINANYLANTQPRCKLLLHSFLRFICLSQFPQPTLLLTDQLASRLTVDQFVPLMQSGGIYAWSWWTSLADLKMVSGSNWNSVINSFDIVEATGPQPFLSAKELATAFNCPLDYLENLTAKERRLLYSSE